MANEEIMEKFRVDPTKVGRYREHWLVEYVLDAFEEEHNIKPGDLCIRCRDGADNPIDENATEHSNFINSQEDDFDPTYRYYYFRPLAVIP